MKVPPPTYSKDRTLTRRTVKGAAGGMKGVDYEDDRRAEPSAVKATTAASGSKATAGARAAVHAEGKTGLAAKNAEQMQVDGKVREEGEMVLDDEDALTRDKKAKENKRGLVARDRMTIDKDAPNLLRKPKWAYDEEEPEEEGEEEIDVDELVEAILAGPPKGIPSQARRKAGDPTLTDPADIHRKLGTPIAYAKHVLLLAEAFRHATGASRDEGIAYLAAMFCAAPDRTFGRLALKELGHATGIIDLYPLEVVEHILERYPAFLPRAGFGTLFSNHVTSDQAPLQLIARVDERLTYPPGTKIRAFAIRGGARPGYRFEPADEDDVYLLRIDSGGRYELLVSGLLKSGNTVVDRFHVEVIGANPPPTFDSGVPERDEARVAAWVVPEPAPFEEADERETTKTDGPSALMSSGEIVQRQQLDALRGPKGDELDATLDDLDAIEDLSGPKTDEQAFDLLDAPTYDSPAPVHESSAASAIRRMRTQIGADPEDDELSDEDAALLNLAVAEVGFPDSTLDDLEVIPDDD